MLYIPIESLKQSPEEASKDIGLVQRMESKSKNVNVCVCVLVFFHSLVLRIFSCYDPLDGPDQGSTDGPRRSEDVGQLRSAAGDSFLGESHRQAVGHQPTAAEARCQAG